MKFMNIPNFFYLVHVFSTSQITTAGALPSDNLLAGSLIVARDSLVNATLATPGRPAHTSPNASILERQLQCEDPRYGLCPDQSGCCPLGGRCCGNNRCCGAGYNCVLGGCCPEGETCSPETSNTCSSADHYPCPNDNVCCPFGTTCDRDTTGEPICRDGDGGITTSTSRTTIVVRTTSLATRTRTSTKKPEIETDIETDFDTPTDAPSLAAFTSTPTFLPGAANEGIREKMVGMTFGLVLITGALVI